MFACFGIPELRSRQKSLLSLQPRIRSGTLQSHPITCPPMSRLRGWYGKQNKCYSVVSRRLGNKAVSFLVGPPSTSYPVQLRGRVRLNF